MNDPRLSHHDSIRQLVARYAEALDRRDLDALVSLHDEDVDSRTPSAAIPDALGHGRAAMRTYFERGLRSLGRSAHMVGTQVIDVVDKDHATGVVYAQAHEERFDPHRWEVVTLAYFDHYVRRDGAWYFACRRNIRPWFRDVIADGTVSRVVEEDAKETTEPS